MADRKKRVDGIETREAILAAAEAEFSEKGFALASAREICRRARANSALMNRYFGSKEALYRIVAKRLFGDLGAPLARLADGVKDEASWRAAGRAPRREDCRLMRSPFQSLIDFLSPRSNIRKRRNL